MTGLGDCDAIELDLHGPPAPAAIFTIRDEYGNLPSSYLVTRPDFGCTLHEAKGEQDG